MAETIKVRNKKTGEIVTLQKKSGEMEPLVSFKKQEDISGPLAPDMQFRKGEMSMMDRAQTATTIGIPAAVAGVPPEQAIQAGKDVLPAAGQAIGGTVGGYPGAVAGATIGEAASQAISMLQGQEFNPGSIAGEAFQTAVIEGAFRGMGKLAFGKIAKLHKLEQGVGKTLGQQKNILSQASVKDPTLQVDSKKIVGLIEGNLKGIVDSSGTQGATLRRFMNAFKKKSSVTMGELMEFKNRLGKATSYDYGIKGKGINDAVNKVSKTIGGQVKEMIEEAAKKAEKDGIKELAGFAKNNAKVSKAISSIGVKGADSLGGVAAAGTAGTMAGIVTGNPLIGTLAGGALIEARNPMIKRFLFDAFGKTGVGRAATLAASEGVRKVEDSFK